MEQHMYPIWRNTCIHMEQQMYPIWSNTCVHMEQHMYPYGTAHVSIWSNTCFYMEQHKFRFRSKGNILAGTEYSKTYQWKSAQNKLCRYSIQKQAEIVTG